MTQTIDAIARAMVAPDKGILAADESISTMKKRLDIAGLPNTPENARRLRQLLFTAPGIDEYLSGVILFDASMRNRASDGTPFPQLLADKGIMPGIKVDTGHVPLTNFPGEEISLGFDTLDTRLEEYYAQGARFTKWRSVVHITDELPTDTCLQANAHVLARYAAVVQEHNMVPMVEPEVLIAGTHTLERSGEVLQQTLEALFTQLKAYRVSLPGLILKTSMALPGSDSGIAFNPQAIAKETLAALTATVPNEVAGVVFLSGGQTPDAATENLNAIALQGEQKWPLTFSYSRAIEEPVLEVWGGDDSHVPDAQDVLLAQLRNNVNARKGTYVTV